MSSWVLSSFTWVFIAIAALLGATALYIVKRYSRRT